MSAASADRAKPRRRWIPLLALLPLLLLVLADAMMAMLAIRTDPGLVADAPRRVGLARMAPGGGLVLDLAVAPMAGGYRLELRLRDTAGMPVAEAEVGGRLERPTHAGADRPLRFLPAPDGAWRSEAVLPDQGAWQVSIGARDAAGRSGLLVARLGP
jgi:nitrogen fixation protein FixH